jgi:hypothetical protein
MGLVVDGIYILLLGRYTINIFNVQSTINRHLRNVCFDLQTRSFSHKLLTSTKFSCNTAHFWCRITLDTRILGRTITNGCPVCGEVRSELLLVRTKGRSYSNSPSGSLVDCDGHCSRSTASGAVFTHNLETPEAQGIQTTLCCTYFDLTEIN